MTGEAVEVQAWESGFWKGLPAIIDYFSDGIAPLQSYLGVGSKEIMYKLGTYFGELAASKIEANGPKEMLRQLEDIWQKYDLGTLQVADTDPLVLVVADCRVCGKLPGTGYMYECAFHEGFFEGAIASKTRKRVTFHQETNYEGEAGTWCRVMVADTKI